MSAKLLAGWGILIAVLAIILTTMLPAILSIVIANIVAGAVILGIQLFGAKASKSK